jgi:hypothetical protein
MSANTMLATSVDIECLFSHDRMILSHMCNCLSAQSVHVILCLSLSSWSPEDFIKNTDTQKLATMEEIEGDHDIILEEEWDHIDID